MQELAYEYIEEYSNTKEFKRLLELKKLIDKKYEKEIIAFKTSESKYLDAKKYGGYYPNLEDLQKDFSNKKSALYSKIEVKEYLELERKINTELNDLINELKNQVLDPTLNNKNCNCR